MAPNQITPYLRMWYKWKALRLPWRKQFLVGLDLHGNTYWEFRDVRGHDPNARWRRIVRYPSTTHYGDVKVPPAWHQWLRQLRQDPPSIAEQQEDVVRQERMKVLAAQADARWAAKPSLTDAPVTAAQSKKILGQPEPPLKRRSMQQYPKQQARTPEVDAIPWVDKTAAGVQETTPASSSEGGATMPREQTWQKMQQQQQQTQEQKQSTASKPDPWRQAARGGPSEGWQPKTWTPTPAPPKNS
ncbi:hypothetical protein B0H66DRAFT_553928 [Apodospora peruviana]|uniref:NADH dehydrogenase [ubiquinone] 1 alpha subcomplex subunit n=1 Tax=Apodospora peruviana TaxID=516989 RepID=A0AAE0IDJ6_9PEZI|nr:hypothetical protein B0H66DRAFT_553928 [Apodospora peruviana]